MHPTHLAILIVCSLFAWTPVACHAAPGDLPTVSDLVARHVQATGGQAAWSKVSTQIRKGVALPDSANLALESAARAPGQWLFRIRTGKGTMTHAFDGKEAWESRGQPAKMGADAALEEGLIYDPFWFLRFREYFPEAAVTGIERNGDTEVYAVRAIPTAGRPKVLFFDVRTGLLTRAGKVMYTDYRPAGPVKVPFLVRYGWQTLKFSEISHGEPVEEAVFRMPLVQPKPEEAKPVEPLPSAAEILDRYLEAVGGADAFRKITSQVRKGALKADGATFPVETYASEPGKWLFVIQTDGSRIDREVYDGQTAWSESAGAVKDMNAGDREQLETLLDFRLPAQLSGMRSALTVKAKEKRGAEELYVVEAAPAQARRRTLSFDAKTGLLVQADGVVFEDYREVGGVKVPFTAKLHGGSLPLGFTEIRNNAPVDQARFEKPAPGPAFEKNFAGLDDARALPVLKRVVGQGVAPSDGRMLYDLIAANGYQRALDIGTARGYAALWFGLAVKKTGGTLTTIEIDPEVADDARANFREAGLDGVIDSRIDDALAAIPALQGNFDFVFMDTGAPLNKKLLDLLYSRIAPGGAVCAHNAGGFKTQQPDFLKAIENDPTLETKIVNTASGGISISVKKR